MWSQKDFEQKDKQKTFKITVKEVSYLYFYVKASNKDEALSKYLEGEADTDFEYGETESSEVVSIEPVK